MREQKQGGRASKSARLAYNGGGFHIFAREWHRASLNRVNGERDDGDGGGDSYQPPRLHSRQQRAR